MFDCACFSMSGATPSAPTPFARASASSALASFCFEVTCYDTIFVPVGHRLASAGAVTPEDCAGETFIPTGVDVVALWRERNVSVTTRDVVVSGREDTATRIETGEGIALTTSSAVPAFHHRAVVPLRLRDPSTWGHVEQHVVWRVDDDSPLVREVVAVARELRRDPLPPTDLP